MTAPFLHFGLIAQPFVVMTRGRNVVVAGATPNLTHVEAGRARPYPRSRMNRPATRSPRGSGLGLRVDVGAADEEPKLGTAFAREPAALFIAPTRIELLSQTSLLRAFGGPAPGSEEPPGGHRLDGVDVVTDLAQVIDGGARTLPPEGSRRAASRLMGKAARAAAAVRFTPQVLDQIRESCRGDQGLLVCRQGVFRVQVGHPLGGRGPSALSRAWLGGVGAMSLILRLELVPPDPAALDAARALSMVAFARSAADAARELVRGSASSDELTAAALHDVARQRTVARLGAGSIAGASPFHEFRIEEDPTRKGWFRASLVLPGFILQGAGGEYFDYSSAETRVFLPLQAGGHYVTNHAYRAWLHVVRGDVQPWCGFPNVSSDFDAKTRVGSLCCGSLDKGVLREDKGPWLDRPGAWAIANLRKARNAMLFGFRESYRTAVYRRPSKVYRELEKPRRPDQPKSRIAYSVLTERQAEKLEREQLVPIVRFKGR